MDNFVASERNSVKRLSIPILAVVFVLSLIANTFGQTPGVVSVIGEVKAIDSAANQMVVRADNGVLFNVTLSDKTQYLRVAPGETSLAKATKITLADVGAGDRVLARGRGAAEQKSVPALQVVVMSKADLAKKQEKERLEWRRRGVSGIVASLNPSTQEITVSSRTLTGAPQAVIIPVTDKVMMRRYPPDTIPKYSDAKPSKFEEVKVGDQLRALGDKSPDGTHLTAEEIVFGTFKIAGGTVTAIDAATNQIKINDLQTKKPLTVILKPESVLRRYPEGGMFGGGGASGPGAANGGMLLFIVLYIACFGLSVGPVTWVILAEIFPTAVRGRALGLATFFLWTADYAVTQTFPMMDAKDSWFVSHFNHAFPFYTYAAFCVVLVLVVWRALPETKGRTLEEIETSWRAN